MRALEVGEGGGGAGGREEGSLFSFPAYAHFGINSTAN